MGDAKSGNLQQRSGISYAQERCYHDSGVCEFSVVVSSLLYEAIVVFAGHGCLLSIIFMHGKKLCEHWRG